MESLPSNVVVPPESVVAAGDIGKNDERLIYRSPELLRGRREIWIEHGRDMYKLRITGQGRLILTK